MLMETSKRKIRADATSERDRVTFMTNSLAEVRARRLASELYRTLRDLLDDTQHDEHRCVDHDCPVSRGRNLIAQVEGVIPEGRTPVGKEPSP
jgi:hypothetical protein